MEKLKETRFPMNLAKNNDEEVARILNAGGYLSFDPRTNDFVAGQNPEDMLNEE